MPETAPVAEATKESAPVTAMDKAFGFVKPTLEPAPKEETPASTETPATETPPVVETPTETTLETVETPAATETPSAVETPASTETPASEAAKPDVVPEKSEVEKLIDLDAKPAGDTPTTTDAFDFSSFAKDMGVSGSTREEVIEAVKTKNKPVEPSDSDFAKADKIQQSGGDGYAYLNAGKNIEDINAMTTQDVLADRYKEETKNNPDFSLTDLIELKGAEESGAIAREHRKNLLADATATQAVIKREADSNRLEVDNGIKDALGRLTDVDGFKVSQAHLETIENDLKTGKLFDYMYYNPETGKKDYKRAAENVFRFRNAEKMIAHHKTLAANSTKKEFIDKLGNVDIMDTRPTSTQPISKKEKKPAALGMIDAMKADLAASQDAANKQK